MKYTLDESLGEPDLLTILEQLVDGQPYSDDDLSCILGQLDHTMAKCTSVHPGDVRERKIATRDMILHRVKGRFDREPNGFWKLDMGRFLACWGDLRVVPFAEACMESPDERVRDFAIEVVDYSWDAAKFDKALQSETCPRLRGKLELFRGHVVKEEARFREYSALEVSGLSGRGPSELTEAELRALVEDPPYSPAARVARRQLYRLGHSFVQPGRDN